MHTQIHKRQKRKTLKTNRNQTDAPQPKQKNHKTKHQTNNKHPQNQKTTKKQPKPTWKIQYRCSHKLKKYCYAVTPSENWRGNA